MLSDYIESYVDAFHLDQGCPLSDLGDMTYHKTRRALCFRDFDSLA